LVNLSLKNIKFEYVTPDDAEFILKLRLDDRLNRFLSKVDGKLSSQRKWIEEYKKREKEQKEHYFLIKNLKTGEKLGTIRVYNIKENECTWGSWIINSNNPLYAIESILLIYKFIFEILNKEVVKFDVRKDNKTVVMFHKSYGAKLIDEDELNYYFLYRKEDYPKLKEKFKKFIKT